MPRKKTASKKKTTCTPIGKTKTFNGKRYKLSKKFKTKTDAKRYAQKHRAKGKDKTARVVVSKNCGVQVFTRG